MHYRCSLLLCIAAPFFLQGPQVLAAAAPPGLARDTATQREVVPVSASTAASTTLPLAAPKLPGDAEYGEQVIVARRANWEPWSIAVDADWSYTDNVALASVGALEDWYLRTGLDMRYSNRISGDWFLNASLDTHAYLHSKFDVLDFLLLKPELGVMRRLPWLSDTFVTFGYVGYWITGDDLTTETFHNHAAALGAQKIWKPSRGQQLVAGINVEYGIAADPEPPQRHEYGGYLAYRFQLTEHLAASASYRASLYQYPNTHRQDWNHVVVIGAAYDLTEWARLSLSASSAWNRSSASFFDYDNIVSGVSLSLHLEF